MPLTYLHRASKTVQKQCFKNILFVQKFITDILFITPVHIFMFVNFCYTICYV